MTKASILIVEDELVAAKSLENRLTRLGYRVSAIVPSGEAALQAIHRVPVDLVLMDIQLRGAMDGVQAAQSIQSSLGLPVVFLTAHAENETVTRATQSVPYAYLIKPVETTELWVTIETVINKYRADLKLTALNTIAADIVNIPNIKKLLPLILDTTMQATAMHGGWVEIFDLDIFAAWEVGSQHNLELRQAVNAQAKEVGDFRLQTDDSSDALAVLARRLGVSSLLAVRIEAKGSLLGVLCAYHNQPPQDDSDVQQFLATVATLVASAVEKTHLSEEASQVEILREFHRLRSELVANVSHELRTPLGLIKILYTTLLRDDVEVDPQTQLEFLSGINEETDKLEAIVNNLLDLSRLESQRLPFHFLQVNLPQMLEKIISDYRSRLPEHFSATAHLPEQTLPVWIDRVRIEQVLRNLLDNAIKYSPQGGSIKVGLDWDANQALVWVSDEGIGISQPERELIFERFYRVDNEYTRTTRGAGLGLSLCRGYVQAHGGRIWVESTEGKGSTFFFTLPVKLPTA